ncbi:hypothetical protein NM208_g4544 [Fusarium decemcellulare]|uniref:Uncharacterized protein n=1 Tax=Fusarium decemcellulare TaxID=57161 RepID=A0ACC1SK63_9HYPO|nr:hypothetical protein NM208_g4544 [Fusarium decemcellulare]
MTSSSTTRAKLSIAADESYDDWYETEVLRRAAKALNIGRGKQLDEIAANDEVTHLVKLPRIQLITKEINLLRDLKKRQEQRFKHDLGI